MMLMLTGERRLLPLTLLRRRLRRHDMPLRR